MGNTRIKDEYPNLEYSELFNKKKKICGKYFIKLSHMEDHYYKGSILNSKCHGIGEYNNSEENYNGEFIKGRRHGNGVLYDKIKRVKFVGTFCDDSLTHGKAYYKNGDVYEGEFKNLLKNGIGKMIKNSQCEILEGYWKMGYMENGSVNWKEKDIEYKYKGKLESNSLNGIGTLCIFKNGIISSKYIGEFSSGKKNGIGVELDNNGKFEGNFLNGLRNGKGILYQNDQKIYGTWENGKMVSRYKVKEGEGNEFVYQNDNF